MGRIAFFAAAALAASGALAQIPSRPITMVVGFAPGGGTDTAARIIAKKLSENLGQPVQVENKPGAGGNVATELTARAVPDGSLIHLASVGSLTVNPHIVAKMPYDSFKDLAPITMAVVFPNFLVVHPSLGVSTLAEFVNLARAKPGTINYGSSGIGGAGHLAGELLKAMAKVNLVHVPYKGGGPAMQGFLGGQVDSFFATPISSISQIRAGKAIAVATTGSKRAALMPDVPTIAESGFPGYEALNWYGFLGPARLPKEILERLNREIVKALANPEAVAQMHKTGVEPQSSSPADFGKYIEREYHTWGKVVKEAGIKPQ